MNTYPQVDAIKSQIQKDKKGILRCALNILIKEKKLRGLTLDIGANGQPIPSYVSNFNTNQLVKRVALDIVEKNKPDLMADAQHLPIKSSSIDTVVCFNLMEHVPDPVKIFKESSRILKNNSVAYFFAPYLTALHSDWPEYDWDFSRLSHASWRYWCNKYFSKTKVYPIAFGPLTQVFVLLEQFVPQFLRVRVSLIALSIDSWLVAKKPYLKGKYLLAVYVEAIK
jgi:SAM-dependent methyltransferase